MMNGHTQQQDTVKVHTFEHSTKQNVIKGRISTGVKSLRVIIPSSTWLPWPAGTRLTCKQMGENYQLSPVANINSKRGARFRLTHKDGAELTLDIRPKPYDRRVRDIKPADITIAGDDLFIVVRSPAVEASIMTPTTNEDMQLCVNWIREIEASTDAYLEKNNGV